MRTARTYSANLGLNHAFAGIECLIPEHRALKASEALPFLKPIYYIIKICIEAVSYTHLTLPTILRV